MIIDKGEIGRGYFYCNKNNLLTLNGLPEGTVFLECSYNNLKTLSGTPNTVKYVYCKNNELKNLVGCPYNLITLDCSNNQLDSLYGGPHYIDGGMFDCSYNNLLSLKYSPIIDGEFICSNNPLIFSNNPLKEYPHFPSKNDKKKDSKFIIKLNNLKNLKYLLYLPEIKKGCLSCINTPVYEIFKSFGESHRTYKRTIHKYGWYDVTSNTIYAKKFLECMKDMKKEEKGLAVLNNSIIKENYNIVF